MANLDDEAIDRKERRIPIEAAAAFRVALDATLEAGHSVLIAEDGKLVRLSPDGERRVVRRLEGRTGVEREGKVPIRWRTAFPD